LRLTPWMVSAASFESTPLEPIKSLRAVAVQASPRSVWTFVEIETNDGRIGAGEGSLSNSGGRVRDHILSLGHDLVGAPVATNSLSLVASPRDDKVEVSAKCALNQALFDLRAQAADGSIAKQLCSTPRQTLDVYANINRRTRDRTPGGFAASARAALEAGFGRVKIAPFDAVQPGMSRAEARPLLTAGFARMAATRDALGLSGRLMVDCHERLAGWMVDEVLGACTENDVFWLEMPIAEAPANLDEIRVVRRRANQRGILLAGAELDVGEDGFRPFLDGEVYDVLMPDITFAGSPEVYVRIGEMAAERNVWISPHNPWGPICHAHSVQVAAAVPAFLHLEMQFDETPLFRAAVTGQLPLPVDGVISVPSEPGLGLRIDPRVFAADFDQALSEASTAGSAGGMTH